MNVAWIVSGFYSGFSDALNIAVERCGCPIVIDGSPERNPNWVKSVSLYRRIRNEFDARCIGRWFILRDMVLSNQISLPVFCPDWDTMIFQNLEQACDPFLKYDFCISLKSQDAICSTAAFIVNSKDALIAMCERALVEPYPMHDMQAWNYIRIGGKFYCGDTFRIVNGSVFDHNIAVGSDRFRMTNKNKTVKFVAGIPHFLTHSGELVKANTIHCWGDFKSKTAELLRLYRARATTMVESDATSQVNL